LKPALIGTWACSGLETGFTIHQRLVPSFGDGAVRCTIEGVLPYNKHYPVWLEAPGMQYTLFRARTGRRTIGYLVASEAWNGLASIDDLAVDASARGHGAARKLVEAALDWARQQGLPGVMLETQDTNVPACRLYERCGFRLEGFDRKLYAAQPGVEGETALI